MEIVSCGPTRALQLLRWSSGCWTTFSLASAPALCHQTVQDKHLESEASETCANSGFAGSRRHARQQQQRVSPADLSCRGATRVSRRGSPNPDSSRPSIYKLQARWSRPNPIPGYLPLQGAPTLSRDLRRPSCSFAALPNLSIVSRRHWQALKRHFRNSARLQGKEFFVVSTRTSKDRKLRAKLSELRRGYLLGLYEIPPLSFLLCGVRTC
jgi:hypothetical protein